MESCKTIPTKQGLPIAICALIRTLSVPLGDAVRDAARPYPADQKPVFVGHYWLFAERPAILAPNVACVDYSVAKGRQLCAYRWSGERVLNNDNFVTVRAS